MRYLILLLLNLPVILLALLNIVTRYKMKKLSRERFYKQLLLWLVVLVVIAGSFPVYNLIAGRPVLDSLDLSAFDIAQTTVIVFLLYAFNNLHQKLDQTERRLRDLHQEVSIRLSKNDKD